MSSIKKNFFYSSILTVSNYIFPLLVFPYVSRVLGVTNIGVCGFVDGVINYFILISMMGVSIVGIREVARVKDDDSKIAKTFSSLFSLNLITTLVALSILIICIYTVPQLYENKKLMYVGVIKLVSNFLLIEWLYTGLEKFKFITNRTIIVKMLYVILIFLFIKKEEDYYLYYILTTLMITINALMNCWFAKKFFKFQNYSLDFKNFRKPVIVLGIYAILTSMYISFNVIFLGFSADNTEVGYYTTASKLYTILLALYSAFTNVMLPRMSFLLADGKMDEFESMIVKSQDILLGFSIPLCLLSIIFAPEIIHIIAGEGYEGAILPMRIIMPLMLIIGYEQILVLQILTPLQKDRAIFINSIFGACTGIALNLILVPYFKSVGSSIVWFTSECVVLVSSQYFVSKFIRVNFPYKKIIINLLWAIPAAFLCWLLKSNLHVSPFVDLSIAGLCVGVYFFIIQFYILKNEFFISSLYKILNLINLKR